jgi:sugar phosphate isomerase/epimerase
MTRPLALAPMTTPELSPPETVVVAARTGYSHIGLRLLPSVPDGFAWPLATDARLLRDTVDRLHDTGLSVLDIDILRIRPDCDPAAFDWFFEAGAKLGAKAVLLAVDDTDHDRATGNYAALCDHAAPFGLTLDIEFMPWTAVPTLAAAIQLVSAADRPNAGIVVDTLHVDRSGTSLSELSAVDHRWLHYIQICDAKRERPSTTDALIREARTARMFPGDGGLDLAGMLASLPAHLPISIEVPSDTIIRDFEPEARARRAQETTNVVLRSTP